MKGEDVGMIVGVAERPTVLLVDDVVNMVVAEGVKILTLVAEVTEGVGCSVCFVHVWGRWEGLGGGGGGGGGGVLCTFIVLVTWEPY